MDLGSALLQSCKPNYVNKEYPRNRLSTGLSLLNLMLSGDCNYGIESGSVVHIYGFSGTGRTTLGLTLLAEACLNNQFNDYDLYYNDSESQCIDVAQYFSSKIADRIRCTGLKSHEAFWNVLGTISHPFIYFLDSLDGLESNEGWVLNNKKAKSLFDEIRARNSILILTSQARVIGKKIISTGGFAIPFYSDYSFSTSYSKNHYQIIDGKKRNVGIDANIILKKNKNNSIKLQKITTPIFFNSGYDDIESMFLFLKKKDVIVEDNGIYSIPSASDVNLNGPFNVFMEQLYNNYDVVRNLLTSYYKEAY